jgi:hypothetical protein
MADPATMMMAGAALGAATNRDDPLKGAMMGAALGGVGGGIASGAMGAAGGAGAAEAAGLMGAEALAVPATGSAAPIFVTPATMAEFLPMAGNQIMPTVLSETPYFNAASALETQLGLGPATMSGYGGAGDVLNPATGAVITGADAAKIGTTAISPLQALSAMNMLGGQQPQQPPVAGGGVRRGDPRLVQQDAIMSLLAPKRVEKRRISLL